MKSTRLSKSRALHLVVIAGSGILLTLPVLIFGVPVFSDDGVIHALWYSHFSEQLWQGDLYPRWLMNMNSGLGSPAFFYYPPLSFFLTSFLRPFFANDPQGWHQVGVSCSIAIVASGFAAYLWLKDTTDRFSAMAAAILYMAMPYHLGDVYLRGSLSEIWAFVWMPLVIFFTDRIANGRRLAFLGLASSYALLIMTHLPTALIFSIVPAAYALFTANKKTRIKATVVTLFSLVMGIGLSAVYLLPALLTQQFVSIDRMTAGYFSYQNWFLFSKWSPEIEDKLTLLLLVVDMIAVSTCAFFISRDRLKDRQRTISRFWFAVAGLSVFMMTELSKPIWTITTLPKIQFPWRFNVTLSIAVTALLAQAIFSLRRAGPSSGKFLQATALTLIVAWIPAMSIEAWMRFPQTSPDPTASQAKKKQIEQAREAPEYRPRWNQSIREFNWEASVDIDNWDARLETEFDSLLERVTPAGGSGPNVKILQGSGHATVTQWRPREIDLHFETPAGASLEVPQFFYPFWTAQMLDENDRLSLGPSAPDGLIIIAVPPGNHEVQLRLERSRVELAGEILSLSSVAIGLAVALYIGYFKPKANGRLPAMD